jgi:hypothetical protein
VRPRLFLLTMEEQQIKGRGMAWWMYPLAYAASVPVATFLIGVIDEHGVQDRHETRMSDGECYFAGVLWPVVVAVTLPEMGRWVTRWRIQRRNLRREREIRIEAEAKVVREQNARAAPLKKNRRRILDL